MKSLKYVIISLLLISIFKKTTPSQSELTAEDTIVTNSEPVPSKLKSVRHSDRDNETKKQHKKRYRSTVKKYNFEKKTATTNTVYVGVEEYNQATTPPNITIPAMVPFGTISEHRTPQEKQLLGGKIHITTLWGIPVYGHRKPIKETEQNLTIGYLWLNQDSIFGIAQMNDGKTFVGVIDDHQPNYIKTEYTHKKTGLVWDWYTHQDIAELKEKYGVENPSSETVREIGMAKINRQRYKLYGLRLPDINAVPHVPDSDELNNKTITTVPNLFTSKMNYFNNQRSNLFSIHNDQQNQEIHPLILQYLAKHWHSTKTTE